MLPSLCRWKLLDVVWDEVALDDLVEFWSRAFEVARPVGTDVQRRAGLRLWGFPRSAGAALVAELSRALAEQGADVRLADPDTVAVELRDQRLGAALAALDVPGARRLAAEFWFAAAHDGRERAACPARAVVVAVGEVGSGRLTVKALCGQYGDRPDADVWQLGGAWDEQLLGVFERFRSSRQVPPAFLPNLLPRAVRRAPTPKPDTSGCDPITGTRNARPGWRGFKRRVALALFPFLVGALLVPVLILLDSVAWACLALPISWAVAFVVWLVLFMIERRRWDASYRAYKHWCDAPFATLSRLAVLGAESAVKPIDDPDVQRAKAELTAAGFSVEPAHQLVRLLDDPVLRKVTAELNESGFVCAGDLAPVPIESAFGVLRHFHAPDGVTCLSLQIRFGEAQYAGVAQLWPAVCASVRCSTRFRAGDRLDTGTYLHPFLMLRRPMPELHYAAALVGFEPLEVYRLHRERVAEWGASSGDEPLPLEPIEREVVRVNKAIEQEYLFYRSHPYDRRDHLRWYLARV